MSPGVGAGEADRCKVGAGAGAHQRGGIPGGAPAVYRCMNRREMLRTVLGALAAGRALPTLSASAQGRPAPLLGVTSHMLRPQEVRQLKELGIRHVRIPGILQNWERVKHFRDSMRDMSSKAEDAGIRILWYLHNITEGYSTPARDRDRARWMERMTEYAEWTARLPATDGVQLWNEVDMWVQMPFGAAARAPVREAGALYAEQLRQAYPVIREARRGCLVVASGMADHPERRAPGFLRGVVAERPPVDAYAIHAYGPWSRAREIVREARGIVGESARLWITEFGNDRVGRWDPERHYETWRSTIEGNGRERLAERMYGYCLQTDPRAPWHGLFDPDGRPRAAFRFIAGRR